MIANIIVEPDRVEIQFDAQYSGAFFCFGSTKTLDNQGSLVLPYDPAIYYNNDFKFLPNDGKARKLRFDGFDFMNVRAIMGPKRRKKFLSPEAVFFVARNLALHHDTFLSRCNAAVVMSYRAIDLNDKTLVLYSFEMVKRMLDEMQPLLGQPQSGKIKTDPEHVNVSLLYLKAQLAMSLCDESSFVSAINAALTVPRVTLERTFLTSAYFTLVLVHRLAAKYIGRDLAFLIYGESFILAKEAFAAITLDMSLTRVSDSKKYVSQLHMLGSYAKDDEIDEEKYFFAALRCGCKKKLYDNFQNFKRDQLIRILSIEDQDEVTINTIFSKALSLKKQGKIEAAEMLSATLAKAN